jgi:uncharacterized DUF497 family protein
MKYRKIVWSEAKAQGNLRKHGVSFDVAREVFDAAEMMYTYDQEHSNYEDRYVSVASTTGGLLAVVWAEPEAEIFRIISARRPTREERRQYFEFIEGSKR